LVAGAFLVGFWGGYPYDLRARRGCRLLLDSQTATTSRSPFSLLRHKATVSVRMLDARSGLPRELAITGRLIRLLQRRSRNCRLSQPLHCSLTQVASLRCRVPSRREFIRRGLPPGPRRRPREMRKTHMYDRSGGKVSPTSSVREEPPDLDPALCISSQRVLQEPDQPQFRL
jgi:hypothetical protein